MKHLKKVYRREKRRATAFWRIISVLSFLLTLAVVPGCVILAIPGSVAAAIADSCVQTAASICFGVSTLSAYGSLHSVLAVYGNFVWIGLSVFALIFLLSLLMGFVASRKLKRSDAYLSYRTLRDALREEKKYLR